MDGVDEPRAFGEDVAVIAPKKDGYTFTGWEVTGLPADVDTTSETITFTMPANNITLTPQYKKNTYTLTVETERLMNVTLCGPAGSLEALTPEQVVIEIDADDFYVAIGQQNIACRLYVPSNDKIFALGSYVVQCKIESN